jgi:hypothetical protein
MPTELFKGVPFLHKSHQCGEEGSFGEGKCDQEMEDATGEKFLNSWTDPFTRLPLFLIAVSALASSLDVFVKRHGCRAVRVPELL